MKYILYALLLTLTILSINSCSLFEPDKTVEPEIPELTTTGEYIFAFRINGEVSGLIRDRRGLDFINKFDEYTGGLTFGLVDNERNFHISLRTEEAILDEGIYSAKYSRFLYNEIDSCAYFEDFVSGYVDIRYLDTEENIISGYFEVTLDNGCGEIVEITEGVFDTGYHL